MVTLFTNYLVKERWLGKEAIWYTKWVILSIKLLNSSSAEIIHWWAKIQIYLHYVSIERRPSIYLFPRSPCHQFFKPLTTVKPLSTVHVLVSISTFDHLFFPATWIILSTSRMFVLQGHHEVRLLFYSHGSSGSISILQIIICKPSLKLSFLSQLVIENSPCNHRCKLSNVAETELAL